MPVFATIMVMMAMGTFDRFSNTYIKKASRAIAVVLVVTFLAVVITGNLFKRGSLSAFYFSVKPFKTTVKKKVSDYDLQNIYSIHGQLFLASVQDFTNEFDDVLEGSRLVIDFTEARIWDDLGASAIDRLIGKLKHKQADTRCFEYLSA